MPVATAARWGPSPATPRTIIANEEVKRLVEARRERDQVMARRVRRAQFRYLGLRRPSGSLNCGVSDLVVLFCDTNIAGSGVSEVVVVAVAAAIFVGAIVSGDEVESKECPQMQVNWLAVTVANSCKLFAAGPKMAFTSCINKKQLRPVYYTLEPQKL